MTIDVFCMTCGTNYKADSIINKCPECERRRKNMKEIMDAIDKLPKTEDNATWRHKGMYGNGTAFAPFMDLYECSNCKTLSVVPFDRCPECNLKMVKGDDDKLET